MVEIENFRIYIKDSCLLINKDIHIFLFILIKYIFLKQEKKALAFNVKKLLDDFIEKINNKIIIKKDKYINQEYSFDNLKNIFDFIKLQNKKYSGDILEGILIYIFSFAFEADKEQTFGKYIFENIKKLEDNLNFDILEWFNEKKFEPMELNDLKKILVEGKLNKIGIMQKGFHYLLLEIFKEKMLCNKNNKKNNITNCYINQVSNKKSIFKVINSIINSNLDQYSSYEELNNSLFKILSFSLEFWEESKMRINLIKNLLIQVYIYYQNKNSPLMNYINKTSKYLGIPFLYDLRGAHIEGINSNVILSPARIEPRINKISLSENNLQDSGLYEIGKVVLFNKNIKKIEINQCLINSIYIDYLNMSLGLFDNYSIEEINISCNMLKENCEEYLAQLISHFKGLKTLILTLNPIKRGISSFVVILRQLYSKRQTKLENLILNNCNLDDSFFYELGELLKCKYCKLKKLCLNKNQIPSNINFLKKLKKNKSLTEIYLNSSEIGNNQSDEIMKIISNTGIAHLYIDKNKFTNFNELLKILYRTKIIEDNKFDISKVDTSFLINLNTCKSDIIIKNKYHIQLFTKFIKQTTLKCIDISKILYGPFPDKDDDRKKNTEYKSNIENLKNILEKDKKDYLEAMKFIDINKVDINSLKDLEKEEILRQFDDEIPKIIENKKSIFPIFLIKKAKNLIGKLFTNYENKDELATKLVDYIKFRRIEKEILEKEKITKLKKLIII